MEQCFEFFYLQSCWWRKVAWIKSSGLVNYQMFYYSLDNAHRTNRLSYCVYFLSNIVNYRSPQLCNILLVRSSNVLRNLNLNTKLYNSANKRRVSRLFLTQIGVMWRWDRYGHLKSKDLLSRIYLELLLSGKPIEFNAVNSSHCVKALMLPLDCCP